MDNVEALITRVPERKRGGRGGYGRPVGSRVINGKLYRPGDELPPESEREFGQRPPARAPILDRHPAAVRELEAAERRAEATAARGQEFSGMDLFRAMPASVRAIASDVMELVRDLAASRSEAGALREENRRLREAPAPAEAAQGMYDREVLAEREIELGKLRQDLKEAVKARAKAEGEARSAQERLRAQEDVISGLRSDLIGAWAGKDRMARELGEMKRTKAQTEIVAPEGPAAQPGTPLAQAQQYGKRLIALRARGLEMLDSYIGGDNREKDSAFNRGVLGTLRSLMGSAGFEVIDGAKGEARIRNARGSIYGG